MKIIGQKIAIGCSIFTIFYTFIRRYQPYGNSRVNTFDILYAGGGYPVINTTYSGVYYFMNKKVYL